LRNPGYMVARSCVPSAIAFLATIILLPVFKLTDLSPLTILLLTVGGTLQGMMIALLVLTISSNKLEGMAVTKLSTLTVLGAVIPFFIQSDIQYIIFPLPSFWVGKAILENMPLYMLPAFVLSAIWIFFLFKRYLRKI
ncbi:MAG: ABC transporter permease, partial [Lachnospiraceae bacterium]|nr:ABC transporter permease [Lachnospiraceae bacterium]